MRELRRLLGYLGPYRRDLLIAAEERVEIRIDRTHEITSRIACTSGGAATQGKFAGNK